MAIAPRISTAAIAKALPALTVVAAIVFALLAYVLLFLPKLGRLVPGGELDLSAYQQRVSGDEAYLASLKKVDADFQQVNADRRARVTNMVPSGADVPGLYVTLEALANAHGLVLTSIDAAPDTKATSPAGRKLVRISTHVTGATYQQFKLFLTDVERSERLLDVESVVFAPGSGSYDMVLHSSWIDASPASPAAPAAAAPAAPASQ